MQQLDTGNNLTVHQHVTDKQFIQENAEQQQKEMNSW